MSTPIKDTGSLKRSLPKFAKQYLGRFLQPIYQYLLLPGPVTSKNDGEVHVVSGERLCQLYGVPKSACIEVDLKTREPYGFCKVEEIVRNVYGLQVDDLYVLAPRLDGDYTLPTFKGLTPPRVWVSINERALQAVLDTEPNNHQLRVMLADELQEYDDPRAEGYRWLGFGGLYPFKSQQGWWCWLVNRPNVHNNDRDKFVNHLLPWSVVIRFPVPDIMWNIFGSRIEADDQAALAYARWRQ